MSYTPNTWQTGDTVTAEKLNNIESGLDLSANAFVVTLTPTAEDLSGTMDKTPEEIYAALSNKIQLIGEIPSLNSFVIFTQFMFGVNNVVCAGQFVFEVSGQPCLVNVVTNTDSATYDTGIFPLTTMT